MDRASIFREARGKSVTRPRWARSRGQRDDEGGLLRSRESRVLWVQIPGGLSMASLRAARGASDVKPGVTGVG